MKIGTAVKPGFFCSLTLFSDLQVLLLAALGLQLQCLHFQ